MSSPNKVKTSLVKLSRSVWVPLYNTQIIISFDPAGQSRKRGIDEGYVNSTAACVVDIDGCDLALFWPERYNINTVSHESVHMAYNILSRCGVRVSARNHESLAYLVGWIVDQVDEFYQELINKKLFKELSK